MLLGARVVVRGWRGGLSKGVAVWGWNGASHPSILTTTPLPHTSPSSALLRWGGGWGGAGVGGVNSGVGLGVEIPTHPSPTPTPTITGVTMDHSADILKVEWGEEGGRDMYPYVWLRDNCQCSTCYHHHAVSRITLIPHLDLLTYPHSIQVVDGGNGVEVKWSDGHESIYQASWLHNRAFNETRRKARELEVRLERKYWGSELQHDLPHASFPDLLSSEEAQLDWLWQLEVYGFVQINNVPAEVGQVRKLAERIAFIRKTHYGEEFTVTAKPGPSNVAYLSDTLQLHTDLPYYEYVPGVLLIHCIVQYEGDGGETQICDAIHVARELQRQHPHLYRALTDTPVDWLDVGIDEGHEFCKMLRLPMICTDNSGEIVRINFSQPQRDSHFSVPVNDVALWYTAMLQYHRLLTNPRYCIQFKMAPGTILSLDNHRVVHGRSSYNSGQGSRHVEGCYMDWDEVRSRRRVLQQKLGSSQQTEI